MKIKFIGVPGEDHKVINMYGQAFPLDQFVDVTSAYAIEVLRNHPHFEAQEVEAEDVKFKEKGNPKTLAEFLEQTVADIKPVLSSLTDEQLAAVGEAESAGKNRTGVLEAVKAEQDERAKQV